MSATLDVEKVGALLENPPVIISEGRAFPVEIRNEDRPAGEPVEQTVIRTIRRTIADEEGSILAFLPGQGEITRAAEALSGTLGADVMVVPLYGNLTQKEQDQAIRPAAAGTRKVVLATSIAETSITIDGVRIVIDSGLQRIPAYEPATGMTRLETVRVSRASADQRAGRAGRTEPGIAIRLWHQGQTAALAAHSAPQVLASDLSGLVLDMAAWGVSEPSALRFADTPPNAAFQEARNLLVSLEALDRQGRLTETGKLMRKLGLPPRLSAMVARTALNEPESTFAAAELAVLITEQGLGGSSIDLEDRLRNFRNDRSPRAQAAKGLASRIAGQVTGDAGSRKPSVTPQPGPLLIHAFPIASLSNAAGADDSSWRTGGVVNWMRKRGWPEPPCWLWPMRPDGPARHAFSLRRKSPAPRLTRACPARLSPGHRSISMSRAGRFARAGRHGWAPLSLKRPPCPALRTRGRRRSG